MVRTLISTMGIAVLLLGCSSVKSDFDNVCNAEARSGATGGKPEDFNNAMKWAAQNVKTTEVKGFMGTLATQAPASKSSALREAAAKAGVTPCPFADSWDAAAAKATH